MRYYFYLVRNLIRYLRRKTNLSEDPGAVLVEVGEEQEGLRADPHLVRAVVHALGHQRGEAGRVHLLALVRLLLTGAGSCA